MLSEFEYIVSGRIKFSFGISRRVGEELKARNLNRVLVVTDKHLRTIGLVDLICSSLKSNHISFEVFDKVEPNPRDTDINAGGELARRETFEAIVAVGGGSVLDTGKGIALLAKNEGTINDYSGKDKVRVQPLPVVAIPTTAGTGSEVTGNIAFTDTVKKDKLSSRSPLNQPFLALLDPELLKSVPFKLAAYTGIDALTHAVEGYLSKNASPITDILALKAIALIGANLRKFVANPENKKAAAGMLLGSTLAGMVITNTGTGNAHAMARALGGQFDLPHGLACAVVLCPVLEFNLLSSSCKLAKVAEALGEPVKGEPHYIAGEKAIAAISRLCRDVGIPENLTQIGIDPASIEGLVEIAMQNVGPNPRRTSREDLKRIFARAFGS